jgi:hypothetical protein
MKRSDRSRYPQLALIARAVSALGSGEKDLRQAGLEDAADQILEVMTSARREFMNVWEQMLKAEGRWSEDAGSQWAQMAMARVYLGDI